MQGGLGCRQVGSSPPPFREIVVSNAREERQEREFAQQIADALGIALDDLDDTQWEVDENASDDGVVYGYVVNFAEGSSARMCWGRLKVFSMADGFRCGPGRSS